MEVEIIITLATIVLAFTALIFDLWSPDSVLLTAVAIITIFGVITIEEAVQQFGNTTIVALASLYVIAASLRNAGALDRAGELILGKGDQSIRKILLRMCPGISVYSGFLNNTPIVAMGIPAIRRWGRKYNISPSKLLMPLSFAAILGGVCTLIGTSTNLIAHGMLQDQGLDGYSFFELAWIGVPCAVVGLIYIIFISPKIIPDRVDIRDEEEEEREALLELEITENAPVVGKTVAEAGLLELPGFFLVRINRNNQEIAPVEEDEILQKGDHLLYAAKEADHEEIPNLTKYPGLRLAYKPPREIKREEKQDRELHQVVVKEGSRLVGTTVEETRMLDRFGAAITGIRRGGKRITNNIGEFVLRPGDVLMLDTQKGFQQAHEDSPDFYLTSETGGEVAEKEEEKLSIKPAGKDLYISVTVLVLVIAGVTAGFFHIALGGILGVAVLLSFNVISPGEARNSIDWMVLIVIGAALALGKAMEVSGAASMIGNNIIGLTEDFGSLAILAGVVVITAILTEIITNNGAIALMFPVAFSIAQSLGLDPMPFIVAITATASMSMLTPIGYQTNLMVYGPGNYKFTDFFKVGFPLLFVLWIVIILLVPVFWPF